jgi:cytokinin riboside 5'-monophosphate phosphoribohydrolase
MRDKSDAFIILPGGTGTVDELMEIIELKKSGFHNKDIIIVNSDGFYDPIINMLRKIKEENFVREEVDIEKLFKVVYEIDDIDDIEL